MAHFSVPNAVGRTAQVELEVRQRGSKPKVYEVPEAGFLIGTVPGCDLRISGNNLPSVICMVSRRETGADLRRLAPTFPHLINGTPSDKTRLEHGDRIGLGDVEIQVHVSSSSVPAQAQVGGASKPRPQESEQIRRQQALADN